MSGSLVAISSVPVKMPGALGAHVTSIVIVCPAGTVTSWCVPAALTAAPMFSTNLIVSPSTSLRLTVAAMGLAPWLPTLIFAVVWPPGGACPALMGPGGWLRHASGLSGSPFIAHEIG